TGSFRTSMFVTLPGGEADTLRAVTATPAASGYPSGLRAFAVRDTHDVALWAMVGQLVPSNPTELPIAVNSRRGANGRLIVFSMPIRVLRPAAAARLLQSVLTAPGAGLLVP